MGKRILLVLAGIVLVALLVWGCYAAITWKDSATIIVEDRWWVSDTRVLYDTVEIETTIDEDGHPVITTGTDTHTRCRSELAGRELPVTYPPVACVMWGGDYVRNRQWFYIKYHVEESSESETKMFTPNLWDKLAPGTECEASWGLLKTITEVEDAQGR